MLTKKQYLLLMFIDQRLNDTGVSPSFEEMKDALELKSKSGIHRLITGLEERGFIRRLPHRARALEVLKLPENVPIGAKKPFTPKIVATNVPASSTGQPANASVELPLYGKIAAGNPVEALRDPWQTVNIPPSMLGRGEHYALEIDGDSMIDAGIHDGDTVVIERCDTAESGAIVVALVDRTEVTLKRLRKKGDSIALEPANKDYETRIFGPDRVNVQGKLVGLLRQY
ncbi:MAG: transcriptional repressor LexA [Rhodospirillales bacterium]|nr:transcriptional repressor LexA [Rhodospirillales bacterium]